MGGRVKCVTVTYPSIHFNPMKNLTVTTAWVIVEEDNHYYLVDGIIYPSEEEATLHLSGIRWTVITLEEHIRAVYELGLAGPSFM